MPPPTQFLGEHHGVRLYDTHHVDGNGATERAARDAFDQHIEELRSLGFELVDPPAPKVESYRARGKSYRWRCGFGEFWPIRAIERSG